MMPAFKKVIKICLLSFLLACTHAFSFCQTIGNAVSIKDLEGNIYTGVIKKIEGKWFQIKYDKYNELRWFTADQFSLVQTNNSATNHIGKTVQFLGTDGKTYTGIVKQIDGNKFLIKYDGYDFESWLDREQFSFTNYSATATTNTQVYEPVTQTNDENVGTSIQNIFSFGLSKGWASPIIETKYKTFLQNYSGKEIAALQVYLQAAKTASAKFFALKSLVMGETYETVTKFINQLNQHDEAYQQENCLVTNERSIIQQLQYSCSVTLLQTFLADLCPRYAWEVKQIAGYDVVSQDPNYPLTIQQKELLEKYGGIASPRGDVSGKSIGIIEPLRELVTPLLGVTFYAQEVNEPLAKVFSKIRSQLDKGINTPLLIGFVGSGDRHFILAMKYKQSANGYSYLIYDPWDGKCGYVTEAAIEQGSLYPLNTSWKISLDYYYPVN